MSAESSASAPSSPSPWRVLLVRIAPWFAVTNLAIVPVFLTMVSLIFSGLFPVGSAGGPPPPPPPSRMWIPVLTYLGIGLVSLVPAQGLLATICLTLSSGGLWRRLAIYWLIALGGLACFFAGIPLFVLGSVAFAWLKGDAETLDPSGIDSEAFWRDSWQFLAYSSQMPMILLGVQLPFWCLRFLGGYRLNYDGPLAETNAPEHEPLSIMDLMLATAIVAITLGLLQMGDRAIAVAEGEASNAFLFLVLIVAAIFFGISLVVAVPLALLFLSRVSLAVVWGVALVAAGLGAVGVFGLMEAIGFTGNRTEQLGINCLVAYGASVGYALGLTALRRAGWRIAFRNRNTKVETVL